jgi:hypothetical protein
MAIYSVFNWDQRGYDYYQAPGLGLGQFKPTARSVGPNGTQVEGALPVLPASARKIGAGSEARGVVAVHTTEALGAYKSPNDSPLVAQPWITMTVGLAAVFLGYRLLIAVAKG